MLSCDKPCCSQETNSCVEHVVAKSYDDLIAEENDELKREVEELKIEMITLKSKSQVQYSQDNRDNMVKKLEKGPNSTIFAPQQDQQKKKVLFKSKGQTFNPRTSLSFQEKKSNVQELGCASDAKKRVTSFQHAPFNKVRSGLTRPVRPITLDRSDRLGPRKPNLTPTNAIKIVTHG